MDGGRDGGRYALIDAEMILADVAAEIASTEHRFELYQAWVRQASTADLHKELKRLLPPHIAAQCSSKVVNSKGVTETFDIDKLKNLLLKIKGQSGGDFIELLRISIMLAILNQLKRQLEGLI